ncbi:MAG: S-layer homology domain-containing protein [Clostridia bacterium]|nr:S-layer homology domain-containing protein [Clostridia bacterium]
MTDQVNDYKILVGSPTGSERELTRGDTEVYVKYGNYDAVSKPISITVQENSVDRIEIVSPEYGAEYLVGNTIDRADVDIRVYFKDKSSHIVEADKDSGVSISPDGELKESDKTLTVSYEGKDATVLIKVNPIPKDEPEAEKKVVSHAYIHTPPTKTVYKDGETFAPGGLKVMFVYTDNTTYLRSYGSTATSTKVLKAGDTSVTVSPTDDQGNSYTLTITGLTVTAAAPTVNVTGFSTSSSYKHLLDEEAEITIDDELDWEKLFEYVYIKYKDSNDSTKYKKIKTDEELEDWLGTSAKLYAIVSGKSGSYEDVVEEDDVEDGEVRIKLYLEYGGETIDSYSFDMKVSDIGCSVTVTRSSTSSTKIGDTKTFEKLKDALEYLEDEDDIIDDFDISSTYESGFAVKIKLGEDQDLGSFEFAPDHDHAITIDLDGYDLELASDWIDYEDCEDLKVTIRNSESYSSSDDDDVKSKMEYNDEDITLIVDSSDTYVFSKDKIPGIYTITVKSGISNGKVEANKTTVAKGGDVKFTITPNTGYEISEVKVNSKSVLKADEYDVNSKGVATYTLKDVEKDSEITATFKKTATTTTTTPEKEEEKKPAADTWTNPFTDISKNAQYYDAVAFVCNEGLFNGMTATKFEPMTTMTRAMFVTVLGRLADIDVSRYSGTSFTDVSKNDPQISWATPYIEWAVQMGITNGTGNGKFSPNDPITHQQMYLFMYRYAMFVENISSPLTGVSLYNLSDANQVADWAEEGVKFASKNGILITSGGKLTPTENALRCELAMLLHGFCTKVLDYNN